MRYYKSLSVFLFVLCISFVGSCQGEKSSMTGPKVGGPCEGCEAIFEYGTKQLTATDTLPGFYKYAPQLKISGTVYKKDGITPADEVILYIYHTNREGIYETRGGEKGWAQRHGYIRGWVKTGKDGKYTFYTFRPAAYPDRRDAEHIHITIKEADKNPYYLDNFVFEDDPLLSNSAKRAFKNRGGSGIVKIHMREGISTIQRDLILGLNIPNYE